MSTAVSSREGTGREGRSVVGGQPPGQHEGHPARAGGIGLASLLVVLSLLAAASIPLTLIFTTDEWVRFVAATVLVSVGLSWAARQLGLSSLVALVANAGAAVLLVTSVFASPTAIYGVLPTPETLGALRVLAHQSVELFTTLTAPVDPHPPLLLVAVVGVWLVSVATAHAALHRSSAPPAIVCALVLFVFPLPMVSSDERATGAVVAFLAAAGLLLLVASRGELRRWPEHGSQRRLARGSAPALLLAPTAVAVAILAGVALGEALPGAEDPAVYDVRGRGGSTVTTNPIVDLRPNLTSQDRGPLLRVTTPHPAYLRTTSLDVYDAEEQWTSEGIRSASVEDGELPAEVEMSATEELTMAVEVADLSGTLVPSPYHPRTIESATRDLQFDGRNATVTVDDGASLSSGDEYTVTAAVPAPDPERLEAQEGFAPDSSLTDLPGNVPDDVASLAVEIVEAADARTPFAQALAIQEELRTWEYSLDPEQGHDGDAMQAFLDNRVGYCEQYAGTMAVMLRSLDIPARVAVGFTPGHVVDAAAGVWEITGANAHAWVEVLFPGHGWLAFEPTPRSDDNVIVPTATDLAPSDTRGGHRSAAEEGSGIEEWLEEQEDFEQEGSRPDLEGLDDTEDMQAQGGDVGGPDTGGSGRNLLSVGGLASAALLGGAALLVVRRRATRLDTRARVLRARDRVERLGRGYGLHPGACDTEAEYLRRVGARLSREDEAEMLAVESARARYGGPPTEKGAARAESATSGLEDALPRPVALTKPWLLLRGSLGQLVRARRVAR